MFAFEKYVAAKGIHQALLFPLYFQLILMASLLIITWDAKSQNIPSPYFRNIKPIDTHQMDSLRQALASPVASLKDRVDRLNAFAKVHLDFSPDTTLHYAQQALKLAENLSYRNGMGESYQLIGTVLMHLGDFSLAITRYAKAVEQFRAAKPTNFIRMAEVFNDLGFVYYFLFQPNLSREHHEKALKIYREQKDPQGEAETLGWLGHYYEKQKQYDQALECQKQALAIYEQLEDYEGLSRIYGNIGSIYEDLAQNEQALFYFQEALAVNELTQDRQERSVHLNNIGDIYRRTGRFEESLYYSNLALQLGKELKNQYREFETYRDLSLTYRDMGDFEKAFQYLDTAYILYRKVYKEEVTSRIAYNQAVFQLNDKESEITRLEQEKKLARTNRVALLGLLVLVFLSAALLSSRQRLKFKKDQELQRKKQELAEIELKNAQLKEQQMQQELEHQSHQLTAHALHIIQKNKMLLELKMKLAQLKDKKDEDIARHLNRLIHKIDTNAKFDEEWEYFDQNFQKVHPQFYKQLVERYPDLTNAEIRLCALIHLNFDANDIANILGISQESLRVYRHRLRKKMNIKKGASLYSALANV